MRCQKCGKDLVERNDYVYVILDVGLAVANLKAFVCPDRNCNYVEFPAELVHAIEMLDEGEEKGIFAWAPHLKYWLKDPDYIFY